MRLIAVVFSEGYLLPGEHFFFFEPENLLLKSEKYLTTQSQLYALFGEYFNRGMAWLTVKEPQTQALILRFIHALLNIVSLVIGYRLARLAGSEKGARLSFALLGLSWLMPFISVRTYSFNLALPFLLGAVWLARHSLLAARRTSFLAGWVAALAIMLYPPVLVFWIPYVLLTFLLGKPIRFLGLALTTLLGLELLNWLVSGKWLIHSVDWMVLLHQTGIRLWDINAFALKALLILGLVLGPPLGFLVLYGFLRIQKYTIRMSLPALVCLVSTVFSSDPLGMLVAAFPFIVITGSQSWMDIVQHRMPASRKGWYYLAVGYFWTFNTILLVWFSTVSPRKQELEAMRYLGRHADYQLVWVEQSSQSGLEPLPSFYCGRDIKFIYQRNLSSDTLFQLSNDTMHKVACVIFRGDENLKSRITRTYSLFPALSFEAIFKPGPTEKYFRKWMHLSSGTLVLYHNDYFKK
ncbi:MAG: hypothetical protein ACP5O2_05490 [Bacteroidales bacterium]